jgi:tricorn protease interacting factor F2/3
VIEYPKDVEVKSYDIFLDLDFKNLIFDGKDSIVLSSGEYVLLNSKGLAISKVSANGVNIGFKQQDDVVQIKTGIFDGILEINYSGKVTDELVGLYRAPYDGNYIFSTQLESFYARRVFPCVDHPGYKAEFRLRLRIDRDLDAISNMPVASVTEESEKKVVEFMKTPRMSTYLLYIGVGRFEEVKDCGGSFDIISAAIPGRAERGRFSMGMAKSALAFYGSYFGIPYFLPKVHLIAVPEFAMGAMENWGAVTFRETALHVTEGSTIRTKKRVAEVVSHELAHMWFGDLVTFRWWNDLWLNESFATFMEYKAVANAYPKWMLWEDFLKDETTLAMARDSLKSTHPIEVEVNSPDEIDQLFDDISYSKGASIIRMIEDYVGAAAFQAGIGSYLKRFKFSNASGDDLWEALEASSAKAVKSLMREWIRKPGYPVLHIKYEGDTLKLRQERFLLSGDPEKALWPLPVTLQLDGETRKLLMEGETESIPAKGLQTLIANAGRTGFYRVLYEGLDDLIWHDGLSPMDKWGIVSDEMAFLLARMVSARDYLNVLQRYVRCEDVLPAQEVSNQLSLLCLLNPPKFNEFSKLFHSSQLRLLERRTDENSVILRGVVARRLSLVDDNYASELGSKFANFAQVEPNMREAVLVAYARSTADFDSLLAKYRASSSDEEKIQLINALMSFKDPALICRSFELVARGEVKRQDVMNMIRAASGSSEAWEVTWDWIKSNISKLNGLYTGTGNLARIFTSILPILGLNRVQEIEDFFKENPLPEATLGIDAGIEMLRVYDRFVRSSNWG